MKSLTEFIESQNTRYSLPDTSCICIEDFLLTNNIDNPTREDLDWYAYNVCDLVTHKHKGSPSHVDDVCRLEEIDEMLNSSKFSQVLRQLNLKIRDKTHYIFRDKDETEYNQGERTVNTIIVPKEIFDIDKIEEICDKFKWTLNSWLDHEGKFTRKTDPSPIMIKGKKCYKIRIEPIQSTNCDDYVYKDCDGILYHLTTKSSIPQILKQGLKMKGSKNAYRKIEDKVFFCCGDTLEKLRQTLIKVGITKGYYDIEKSKFYNNAAILRINVKKYNVHFYEDPYYNKSKIGTIFSYAYFPPNMMEEISFKDVGL